MILPFLKMHGLGNDFIVIDHVTQRKGEFELTSQMAQKLCDRRFGVGCDQILWMLPARAKEADARMEIRNADGSQAEMCGNGIRAAAVFLRKYWRHSAQRFKIETLAGIKHVDFKSETEIMVDMGVPKLGANVIPSPNGEKGPGEGEKIKVDTEEIAYFDVNTGVPHIVIFVKDVAKYPADQIGPKLEVNPRFPHRTNVNFVEVLGKKEIKVRTWERGAGLTMACGTGACASAVAALATGRGMGELLVHVPGGDLRISWGGPGKSVLMTGPAVEVFKGEIHV